ncbi:cytochrome c1 [Rhizorhapis suberifaciens]|uniref:Cytochrome c1 n=1 Tax=Rhizorhapis suberifaciens TaxID=13656 RepID=A0A840HRK2_9SPHN|nr:cytochrome c1 [Rhizorhapis suberifaciens]MBB4640257.1 ubiquinol-cytochrome c reductase cytochrome c1 subunit [Rhizorhapis suberifaciens]
MVRVLAALVGIFFSGMLLYSFVFGAVNYVSEPPAPTAEHEFHLSPKEVAFASDGPFGHYDRQQLQRGFQVYKEVCSACHSLRLVAFRDLEALGYNEAEVKAIAANWSAETPSVNEETGEPATRKPVPADYFPQPFANDVAARAANNNAVPPDLSLMTKARHHGNAYIYSLLTGYQQQPAELLKKFPDVKTPQGLHYNPYFANLNLAMAPPLTGDGQVTYADGTKATVSQMAKDVAAFLTWTAEPKLENRHRAGVAVIFFLIAATILAYMSYRNIWADKKH